VDHHLARARAIGRRAASHARTRVWESLEAVQRAVDRLHEGVTIDIAGDHQAQVRVERQDLDEMLGNLVENAAKYGGGRVFVTVQPNGKMVDILVEDDGPESPRSCVASCSPEERGSTQLESQVPVSVSPSSATLLKSTAARSRSRKAKTLVALWRGSLSRPANYRRSQGVIRRKGLPRKRRLRH